jgi:membrane-associated phospholipid phosphatase
VQVQAAPAGSAVRRLLALAIACAVLVGLLYLFFVCTRLGQRIDDAAVNGRSTLAADKVQDADDLLQTVDIASVVLLGGAVALVAVARGRLLLGVAAVALIGAANLTTQAMKAVLPRSDLVPGRAELIIGQSMPSGHTTVAASIVVAAVLVAPRRLRGPVAVVGALYAAAVGVATLTAGWHRPSDAVAAFAVVVAWGAAAAWFVAAERPGASLPRQPSTPLATPVLVALGVGLSAAAFTGLVAVLAARRLGRLDAIDLVQAYAGATVAITGSALLLVGLFLAALRPVALDVRR